VTKRYLFIGTVPYEDGLGPYHEEEIRSFTGSLAEILIYSVPLSSDAIFNIF
jgi:hypothetical protein